MAMTDATGAPQARTWTLTLILLGVGAVAMMLRSRIGVGYHFGDVAAFALMIAGVILCRANGLTPQADIDEEEETTGPAA